MTIKPRNGSTGGMARSANSSGISKKSKAPGTVSAIEQARHNRDGFTIDDSNCKLDQFKWFISEREQIREKKERGDERPWTEDEILNKTKFTNIYRQDDKVSRFIFSKLRGLPGPLIVYNLILSRLINRVDVLNKILPSHPMSDISFLLDGEAIMMNSGAYQVSPGMVKLDEYSTNRETIVYYPKKVYTSVYEAITSTTDIKTAVELGNKAFGGHIPFTMLQIVLDYQYLTWQYDENSDVPVGQGARAVVDALGGLDYLSKELSMTKYDVEHAACEFRKYIYRQGKKLSHYSYKPNSMGI